MHVRAALLGATALPPGLVLMAATSIEDLQAELAELEEKSNAILALADKEDRDLTDEEVGEIDANAERAGKVTRQIEARKKAGSIAQGQGRRTAPEPGDPSNSGDPAVGGQGRRVPAQPRVSDARGGFRSFGEFAQAVRLGSIQGQGHELDQRLRNAATTYGNEGVGADGGFLVPPEFSREMWAKVMAEENLLNRCAPLQTSGNSIAMPKDETTPWQTSGGVQVYWEGEGAAATASKPVFEYSTFRLFKLMGLVPISEELLDDAVGLESWLRAKAPAKMAAKINTAIVRGTGAGQPLGILNAPSHISVAKETSQPADTVWFANINKMWARMYAPWRRNAVWLINQDTEPQLEGMAFDPAASSKVPVYLPAGGLSASPYASLKGRPVVPIEACSTVGDKGDIILVDLNQYWALTKSGGIRTDTSIHLYFDQAITTFRFIFRVNGQPAWSTAITPENGSQTRSWAVTLDERA